MIESDVLIVGAGPAGATCAKKLKDAGVSVRLLDKHPFPRNKLCAGWIQPQVFDDLEIKPGDYPHSIHHLKKINFHFRGLGITLPTDQYAIRRIEFDNWLVERSNVSLTHHFVNKIRRENDDFVVDDTFKSRILVGAGGTSCPVYQHLFKTSFPRGKFYKITTLEEEFSYRIRDNRCYIWFFDFGIPGYAWYVPKPGNILNIGIGGRFEGIKKKGMTIREYWNLFVRKLEKKSLVTRTSYSPKGYNYYFRERSQAIAQDNAYIIGDAAGLATVDMGEGIGPAIKSGIIAADAIINHKPFEMKTINKYSVGFGVFLNLGNFLLTGDTGLFHRLK